MRLSQLRAISLLFFSGAAALIYQTIWVRQLSLVVGLDVYAITTAVAAFFAGLALGSAAFGRRADQSQRPLRLYAILEVGIAVFGVGATVSLARVASLFVTLQDSVGGLAWLLPLTIVGIPAFLMGGTLPALIRDLTPDHAAVGKLSGVLYAANTAGAVAGTISTPFILIPMLGVQGAACFAGAVNVLVAFVAFLSSRLVAVRIRGPRAQMTGEARLGVALYAVSGGVAMGYEIIWTQIIVQFLSTRAYAFAIVLATYLTGLFVGSLLYASVAGRIRSPWTAFGLLIGGAGASSAGLFMCLGPWLPQLQATVGSMMFDYTESRLAMMCGRFFVASAVLVLPTTILLGAAFPAAVRVTSNANSIGRDIGLVVGLNTAGGIAGTFLVGFCAIPSWGLAGTLGVLAVTSAVVGSTAVLFGRFRSTPKHTRDAVSGDVRQIATSRFHTAVSIALATLMSASVLFISVRLPHDKLARLLVRQHGGTLVFYQESPGGTVAVLEDDAAAGAFRRLYIQGVSNSGDSLPSLRYMRLQALLPLLIHNAEPRSALVIGHGTGITAGSLLACPDLDRRVCAELLPAVISATSLFEGNMNVGQDPRVEYRVRDGRHVLLSSEDRYDLITLEPPPPSASGVVNLYSREFYELARDRLEPHGLFAQWWPLATQNNEDSQSLVRSFIDVFPHATLWSTEMHETLLIGSIEPILLDAERVATRFRHPSVSDALQSVGVSSTTELLATYITDRDGLVKYTGDARAVTDDRPAIEHADWLREGEFPRVLQLIAEMRTPPPIASQDPSMQDDVELARHKLWTLYRAGYYAYTGELDRWESMLTKLGPELRRNPYYRWFVTESN